MSVYSNSTQVFIDLLSDQDFNDFKQKIVDLQDDEDIAEAIDDWLKAEPSHDSILQAYQEKLKTLPLSSILETSLGAGNSQSPVKPNQPSSRQLIDNAIIQRKPSPEPPPQQP